jgi:hypothetical protein
VDNDLDIAIVDTEGAHKAKMQNRLVKFGIENVFQALEEDSRIVLGGKRALYPMVDHRFTSPRRRAVPTLSQRVGRN